jgi:hypothetical protein
VLVEQGGDARSGAETRAAVRRQLPSREAVDGPHPQAVTVGMTDATQERPSRL